MSDISVHVYKIEYFFEGKVCTMYELQTKGHSGSIGNSTLEGLAGSAKIQVDVHSKDEVRQVSIDFTPYHDIVCPANLVPRQCFPLTKEEKQNFWEHFSKLF